MFLGRFEHALDAKYRLALPARFRARVAGGFVVTPGFDHCLVVHPLDRWEAFAAEIDRLPDSNAHVRMYRRMVFSDAIDGSLDAQGRFVVPPALRAWAGIEREAIVVGVHGTIEIWTPERWYAATASFDDERDAVAEAIAVLRQGDRHVH